MNSEELLLSLAAPIQAAKVGVVKARAAKEEQRQMPIARLLAILLLTSGLVTPALASSARAELSENSRHGDSAASGDLASASSRAKSNTASDFEPGLRRDRVGFPPWPKGGTQRLLGDGGRGKQNLLTDGGQGTRGLLPTFGEGNRKYIRAVALDKGKVKAHQFKLRPGEEGLSVFEMVDNPNPAQVLEAVRAAGKQGDLAAVELSERDILEMGLDIVRTEGGTPSAAVNAIHFELRPRSDTVRALASQGLPVHDHFNNNFRQRLFELARPID